MHIEQYQFFQKLKNIACIEEIWLYGSRARGDNQDRSDIDIAILTLECTNNDWQKIQEIINNADTLLKIDVVKYDQALNETFKANILRDKRVIYKKAKK